MPTGTALRLVAVEKPRATPAGKHRRELPSEIDCVSKSGIQSKTGGWMVKMSRIAGEKDAAMLIAVGNHIARCPAPHGQDFVRHVLANRLPEESLGVDLFRRVVILLAADAETIQRAAIKTDEVTPQPLGVDERDQCGLAHRVMSPQFRRAHEDAEEIAYIGGPAHLDAERGTDHAAAAAAIDQIARGDLEPLVVRAVVYRGDDMVADFA